MNTFIVFCAVLWLFALPAQAQWAGTKVGIVDNNGKQLFTASNPGSFVLNSTTPGNPTTLLSLTPLTIAVTGTAVCFPAQVLLNGLVITAQHTSGSGNSTVIAPNINAVWVGGTGVAIGTGAPLAPGNSTSAGVGNASAVCANGTAGDGITAIGN